ncbi:unnamed protein product [Choristocarpus tenellus]
MKFISSYLTFSQVLPSRLGVRREETHTDLREWYVHCLNFLALKRRLVDDPPDPWDDHPSMADSPDGASIAVETVRGEGAEGGKGVGSMSKNAEGERVLGSKRESHHAFRDPASRVFVFELSQELDRLWTFYSSQSVHCSDWLSSLQDETGSQRHQLNRKLQTFTTQGTPVDIHVPWSNDTRNLGNSQHKEGTGEADGDSSSGAGGMFGVGIRGGGGDSLISFDTEPIRGRSRVTDQLIVDEGNGGGVLHSSSSEGSLDITVLGTRSERHRPRSRSGRKSSTGVTSRVMESPPQWRAVVAGGAGEVEERGEGELEAQRESGVKGSGTGGRALPRVTEDPYVKAGMKRGIVGLYNKCNRLLSFKVFRS